MEREREKQSFVQNDGTTTNVYDIFCIDIAILGVLALVFESISITCIADYMRTNADHRNWIQFIMSTKTN